MTDRNPRLQLALDWPTVPIYVRFMPETWGQTVWPDTGRPYIELAHDLGYVQQRCTLAHEYHHLQVGRPCTSFCEKNEQEVCEKTARWLLPDLAAVGCALGRFDMDKAAETLHVTTQVLNHRLLWMGEEEQDELAPYLAPATSSRGVKAANAPESGGRLIPPRAETVARPT